MILQFLLFIFEVYHVISHVLVLFGIRLLPRKDLVKVRYYFLFDTGTVALTILLVTKQYLWLGALQMIQHLFYFFTWDKSEAAKKVISWSSLDWTQSRLVFDLVLGTIFDIVVHLLNVYLLSAHLPLLHQAFGVTVAVAFARFIFYNPKLAWSSPNNIPQWIQRRMKTKE